MSGLARLLLQMGHQVRGSDRTPSGETKRLQKAGLEFYTPHTAEAVKNMDVVVYSSAIRPTNTAYAAALTEGIPLFRRAECLAAILQTQKGVIISGTHGKTTTSAMTAHLLRQRLQPASHYVGAEIPVLGSNAEWHEKGEFLVAEGDESDGTLALYHPQHCLVLNVEEEHLDFYEEGLGQIRKVFRKLIEQTAGSVVYCADCPEATFLCASEKNSISYGLSEADWTASELIENAGTTSFMVSHLGEALGRVELGIPGRHNVLNALGAMALAHLCGLKFEKMVPALESFAGAKRRFETKYFTEHYRLVDDYGHHPTEIAATLQTASSYGRKRIVVLFQPHRYSRTQRLAQDFGTALQGADKVFVTEVYAASEEPIPGVSGQTIVDAVNALSPGKAVLVPKLVTAHHAIGNQLQKDDLIITLGAGNVHEAGTALIKDLSLLEELERQDQVEGRVRLYEPMARHSTIRVGGPAQFWVEPDTVEGFVRAVRFFKDRSLPVRVVGRGSNLLVRDGGIRGAVIHPKGGVFSEVKVEGMTIQAGAGVRFKKLASVARENGIGGFEWMEGIPGNVGGGLRMNAGAMGVETFDQVVSVTFYDEDGQIRTRSREEIETHYRNVPELARNYALVATFTGEESPPERIQGLLDESRHHRNTTQPKAASAGCTFKNPAGIGAGKLIDDLGLKGSGVGKAEVSPEHGNFVVNRGRAKASEVLALIEEIRESVLRERGVRLETEVQIIGDDVCLF